MSYNTITYEGIRSQLVDYFSKQDQFKSYNFAAPAISTLIDALAYSVHYMSIYANFALNESFLDTASQRTSVVSKAKALGYMPYQYTSSKAKVRINYDGTANLENKVVLAGTEFIANLDNVEYVFHTLENTPLIKTSNGRYYADLEIREGTIITERWEKLSSSTRFILTQPRVDLDHFIVKVYESSSDTIGVEYKKLQESEQIGPNSAVYTVIENTTGDIEILFGDNYISKKLDVGNIVECIYLASSGSESNNIVSFALKNMLMDVNGVENYSVGNWRVSNIEQSIGGADKESIESVRMIAPKFFQRQNRDVVADDYKTAILSKFDGIIDAISVWGGEDNIPPLYGSVCICIKPKNANKLTSKQKADIQEHIEKTSVVGITSNMFDPEVLFINAEIETDFLYTQSRNSSVTLKDRVNRIVNEYFLTIMTSFNVKLTNSKLVSFIYQIDDAITDVNIRFTLYKKFLPIYGLYSSYEVNFNNEIIPNSVTTEPFLQLNDSYKNAIISDDGNGKLFIEIDERREEIGTVDYTIGKLKFTYDFKIFNSAAFNIYAKPATNNITTTQNEVFSINNVIVKVNDL